ncbi:hypothetical protein [Flavobacterium gelidilacus]|uniref:hypothetical protein n=1 Tax=Flavobacterium gelidilacus TaxID=206041 RepID=UPI001FDF8172|nr:hypothetical protein [Flavobacterium gelidilacus]
MKKDLGIFKKTIGNNKKYNPFFTGFKSSGLEYQRRQVINIIQKGIVNKSVCLDIEKLLLLIE